MNAGSRPLRILVVEDNRGDAELNVKTLARAGFQMDVVYATCRAEAESELEKQFDVVLADYRLPDWTGMDVLAALRARGESTPVILVTGTLGDDLAVACLKEGLSDYVLKGHLQRLPVAVQSALAERQERAARDRLEEQFRHAQKMEAVGRLAGGVAHDFNNLLTVIVSYVDLMLLDLTPNHPHREDLQEIRKAADAATSLTRQLLAFSRQQVVKPRVVGLEDLVAGTEKMLARVVGEDISLETRLAPDTSHVLIDPGQLEQVIMNLAVNARDAMPTGGKLTISTSQAELTDDDAHARWQSRPGRYAVLAIEDTGVGMDEEVMSRIFDPFFTTKEVGKGTGLGLATVYGIVNQANGFTWVHSAPGEGATFRVHLPLVESEAIAERPSTATASEPHVRGATVLLVEDAASVREITKRILQKLGYTVLEASRGDIALTIARNHPHQIDLLLTDVVMPEMGGGTLAQALKAFCPSTKVLYMSGYTDDAVVRHGVLAEGIAYLEKPFTPTILARKVREVLESS